jgi:phosphoribosyl 1,2-cyclic phosphodiesterase
VRFASLGSGSAGNALVVEAGATRVMLDCGFGLADCLRRLQRIGVEPESIAAILVTHEHDDHVGGVPRFARRYRTPVHLTYGTLVSSGAAFERTNVSTHVVDGHSPFAIGELEVFPFPVPHDARDPVQYVISDGVRRLGVLTDTGGSTEHIEAMLTGVEALVLECNYDEGMLRSGGYPPVLQRRIAGRFGHLANSAAAELLSRLDASRLQHLIAAHLSLRNNHPALARAALARVLGCSPDWMGVAGQDEGFGWRSLS